jgi:hypothetical protein
MLQVKLGSHQFDEDSEEMFAGWSNVSAADCVAMCARMKAGECKRLKSLMIVRFLWACFCLWFGLCVDVFTEYEMTCASRRVTKLATSASAL